MSGNSGAVRFLYGTAPGRLLLKGIMATHADRLAVAFLRSRLSRFIVGPYARRNGMELTESQRQMLDRWSRLTPAQQEAFLHLLDVL